MRPAASPVARSAIAGRAAPGCSASKLRATGPISAAATPAVLFPGFTNRSQIDAFGLFTGQVGYAWNNALLYVKGGAAVTDVRHHHRRRHRRGCSAAAGDDTRWGAVVGVGLEYGFAPNWSAAVEYDHMFMGTQRHFTDASGAFVRGRPDQRRHRPRHRPRQLSLGWPGHREVLIDPAAKASNLEKAGLAPAFLFRRVQIKSALQSVRQQTVDGVQAALEIRPVLPMFRMHPSAFGRGYPAMRHRTRRARSECWHG